MRFALEFLGMMTLIGIAFIMISVAVAIGWNIMDYLINF